MGRAARIARRGFLIGSAAIAGGVAFGIYRLRQMPPNPLTAGPGEAVLNPHIVITPDAITVITPRAEMGQGNQTTLAALAAEELDAPWHMIRAEHGPPGAIYANQALLAGGPRLDGSAPSGLFGALKAELLQDLPRLMGLQVTGGSTAMRDGFVRMRLAGAAARAVLVQAAARRWGLPADSLTTRNAAVHAPDGRSLPYGALAAEAARIAPPQEPPLKPRKDWRLIGRDLDRLDMEAKVTGRARFGIDTVAEGMLFATVRISPRLGASMARFDASRAEAMPDVRKVVDLGTGIAVIATNTWLAMQAAEAVEIEWNEAPYPLETEQIFARIEQAFEAPENAALRDDGDAPGLLDKAPEADVITAEYRVPWLAHTTMEPMNATALFTGDSLTLWVGNQAPILVRDKAARAVGLDPERVTVHTPFLGGGFGRRVEPDAAILAARVAAAMPGVAIKTTWTREEDITHDYYRPAAIARFRGLVDKGGIRALEGRIAAPSVNRQSMRRIAGFAPPGADRNLVEGAHDQPYAIPHYRIAGHVADLDIPVGFWRSVGNSHNAFFHESFIDELAHAAGLDPVELRLRLTAHDRPARAVIERVAQMAGWTGRTPKGIGRGVAFTASFGAPTAEIVEVRESPDGIRITQVWAATDVGLALDPRNIRAQVMSGVIYGLSAAVMGEITFSGGEVEQQNFPDYDALRMSNAPDIAVSVLENQNVLGGIGEPGTPPAAPALANALFDLTGRRARSLPLNTAFDFA